MLASKHFMRSDISILSFFSLFILPALSQTGYNYTLDTEYSGSNFFDGWNFFTGSDPTNGHVKYQNQTQALTQGLINSSATAPAYIGVDYTNMWPYGGPGRPSVRIETQKTWTHGLFIGDFSHAPGGICGTWPAFWTIGPNWPYTGEIDILEGVNLLTQNAMSLHTNVTCTIAGDSTTETGILQGYNCAYYPATGGNPQGCGVLDTRNTSYGVGFNQIGGGVYAMQWTSDFIKVWFFSRSTIPADITNKAPNPAGWGLPAGYLTGSCNIDQHFVSHRIIFDNTFCGDYAGNSAVWNSTVNSCATLTGYPSCGNFVGNTPSAFQNAYWSVNSVRVYQLLAASASTNSSTIVSTLTSSSTAASAVAASTTSTAISFAPSIPTSATVQPSTVVTSTTPLPSPTTSLCPNYSFQIIMNGAYNYEIECGYQINGHDLGLPSGYQAIKSFQDCLGACNSWNNLNGVGYCVGLTYAPSNNACYPKNSFGGQAASSSYYGARLIYSAYPGITDSPSATAVASSSSSSSALIATSSPSSSSMTSSTNPSVTPVHYSNPTSPPSSISLSSASAQSSVVGVGMGALSSATSSLPSSSAFTIMSTSIVSLISSTISPTTQSSSLFTSQPNNILLLTSSSSSSSAISGNPTSSSPSAFPSSSSLITSSLSSSSSSSKTSSSSISAPLPSSSSQGVTISSLAPSYMAVIYTDVQSYPSSSSVATMMYTSSSIISPPPSPTTSRSEISSLASSSSTFVSPSSSFSWMLDGGNGDATNYVGPAPTSTPSPAPPPPTIDQFAYDGCVGSATGYAGFQLVESSDAMSIEQCLSDCYNSAYAGISYTNCYCGNSITASSTLITYPDGECNTPCPGDPSEVCGGEIEGESSFERRQSNSGVVLLTLYNNTMVIQAAMSGASSGSSSSVSISSSINIAATSVGPVGFPTTESSGGDHYSPMSGNAGPTPFSSGIPQSSVAGYEMGGGFSISGDPGANGLFPSNSVSSTSTADLTRFGTSSPAALPTSSGLTSSIKSTVTTISTVWIDVCDVCDGGFTTLSTTVTRIHCGCTDEPLPTIPMITTTKPCAVCGENKSSATVTVTEPDRSAISALDSAAAGSAAGSPGAAGVTGSAPGVGNGSLPGHGFGYAYASQSAGGGGPAAAAGTDHGATPAHSHDVPLMTNTIAASVGFGLSLINGSTGTVTANVTTPATATFTLQKSIATGGASGLDVGGLGLQMASLLGFGVLMMDLGF